jgi:hypothetical protein
MVASGQLPAATPLKVGQHSSRSSTIPEFFAAVHPQENVVAAAKTNTFGHPRGEVIERVAAGRRRLYRVDEFGLTTFLLDCDGGIHEVIAPATSAERGWKQSANRCNLGAVEALEWTLPRPSIPAMPAIPTQPTQP